MLIRHYQKLKSFFLNESISSSGINVLENDQICEARLDELTNCVEICETRCHEPKSGLKMLGFIVSKVATCSNMSCP